MNPGEEEHEAQLAAPEVSIETDGRLTVPADHVTALLRSIAHSWAAGTRDGIPVRVAEEGAAVSLEPVTVRALADTLTTIADELDVQYIHITTHKITG
ncbi:MULTISPECIES: hypothetical protein [unclassified Streptomyces]|uniref:hypothetical protein n=1 Tax=unclassified Streptomyces TaxID=2593676 RepID=UPI002557726F|nr:MULTISPECIES: hypothetical protein [unclassified Streptomyces]WRZ62434.1 hypothetical protein OG408_00380 [Streptomyces sp. NBC_01257]WSU56404.1 hypothetical protein OG450_00420 [Streptomyces sp. NBC_01104]